MSWPWEIVERDHELQNPTSPEKILALGEHLRLGPGSRVLDVACGKCGPALLLARAFGCSISGIELRESFADDGRARVAAAGLAHLIDVQTGDAAAASFEPASFDAALCLGAAFVWGHVGDAAEHLLQAVRPGGGVAVGEPFWRTWPLPRGPEDQGFVELPRTVARFEAAGVVLTGLFASSEDDWDRYESLHWRAVEEWLAENPDHPDGAAIHARHLGYRRAYLEVQRALLGWAIFVGRRP